MNINIHDVYASWPSRVRGNSPHISTGAFAFPRYFSAVALLHVPFSDVVDDILHD